MKRTNKISVFSTLTATLEFLAAAPHHANAGMEPFVGEINYVAFNFAPQGWFQCDGQTLPINQYQALFALIGTTYGGNGISNFKLPDLRDKMPVHQGSSAGFSVFRMGQTGDAENITSPPRRYRRIPIRSAQIPYRLLQLLWRYGNIDTGSGE